MKKLYVILFSLFGLVGCHALNFKVQPDRLPHCQYNTLAGIEFQFNQLPQNKLTEGFNHIYVAQSRASATLSSAYQGMKGKLTGEIIQREYPDSHIWIHRFNALSVLFDDDVDNDLYLTTEQKVRRDRNSNYIFYKAILSNCQIVYISVNSLSNNFYDPQLISDQGLTVIND
ncbi:hypothetical protein JMI89_05540 [Frischella sp. Ac48]|uniref:hypothetical protein n=1 Tax=Frischella sp. Ac48 TaxID=2804531 RepID=UPI001C7DF895|nr:hypothetical protein [Frischella sp. Ac48]MBX4133087.1 hypothetical protein [Frischella sp. Ac48]